MARLNEGQNWEAFQFMAHNKLNNCIVFIDYNKRQHDGYCEAGAEAIQLMKKR